MNDGPYGGDRVQRMVSRGLWVVVVAAALGLSPASAESDAQAPESLAPPADAVRQPVVRQWALEDVAWSRPNGGDRVLVAVLDSGIDWRHPDLGLDRIWRNAAEKKNGIDDDGNGFVDDQIGWDFVEGQPEPWDDVGHGTHVAGLISAEIGNELGIEGMSRAVILPLKVIGPSGQGRAFHIVAALDYALGQGARVINLSVGGEGLTAAEKRAVRKAAEEAVVVIAAGNRSEPTRLGLAGTPGVVVVTATGRDGLRAGFSNHGSEIQLAAPGVDIVSLRARGTDLVRLSGGRGDAGASVVARDYLRASGTSFAAALVSGAAARILSDRPQLTPAQVVRVLEQTARDVDPPGVDARTGFGRLDLGAALKADPNAFLVAALSRIELAPGGQVFRVIGRAEADAFQSATLKLEPQGIEPTEEDEEPKVVARSLEIPAPVSGGILLRLDRGSLADAREWLLTLTVTHQDGRTRSASLVFAAQEPATEAASAHTSGNGVSVRDVAATDAEVTAPARLPPVSAGPSGDEQALQLPVPIAVVSEDHELVELTGVADLAAWARERGVPQAQAVTRRDGSAVASLPKSSSSAECANGACEADACRTYQARLDLAGSLTTAGTVRVADSPPPLSFALQEDAVQPNPEIPPGRLTCAESGSSEWPFDSVPSKADGSFQVAAIAPGEVDRGCFDLITEPGCAPSRSPLRDLVPELEPGRISVLVPNDAAGAGTELATLAGLRLLDSQPLPSVDRVLLRFEIKAGTGVAAALSLLSGDPRVDIAQQERRYRTMASYADPLGALNYGPEQIGAVRLHDRATGSGVRVAVIDSGVDASHPELTGRIAESLDTTGYGVSADRHGTAVAGLIAAQPNNGAGAWGAAPGADIIAIKACQSAAPTDLDARCWSATVAKAIDLALAHDAAVINLSIAGPEDPIVEVLVSAAIAKGVLVVAASGNGGPSARPSYPAALDRVLAVTAVDANARLYGRATRGPFVDVAAPGVEVVSPAPDGAYPVLSGTSFATAFVSGAAALLLELQEEPNIDSIRDALEATTQDLGDPGPDPLYGRGRIDLCAAAEKLMSDATVCP